MNQLIKKSLIFLISVTLTNQAFAATTLLEVGQPAPYRGWLMDEKTTKDIREDLLLKDKCLKDAESLMNSLTLCQQNREYADQQKDLFYNRLLESNKALEEAKTFNTWEKVLWSVIGGAIVFGVMKLGN